MTTATPAPETKTRAARKPVTEFGQSFRGFVSAVNQDKLSIKVGNNPKVAEKDSEKVHASIQNLVRKAGQNNGVVSVRSQDLVEATIQAVVELDPDLAAKGETLKKAFQYVNIPSGVRSPSQNWIVRLKLGEEVALTEGPDGDGVYKLTWVRDLDVVDETVAVPAAE